MSKSITDTDLNDFFDEATATAEIMVLEQSEAGEVWARYFEGSSGSFFQLPDSSWVASGHRTALGRWIDDINNSNDLFEKGLRAQVPWSRDDHIFFAVSSSLMLACPWHVFLANWRCFLNLESDAPMILAEGRVAQCVLFRPIGDAMWIVSSRDGKSAGAA
jgi:hypothetical protein